MPTSRYQPNSNPGQIGRRFRTARAEAALTGIGTGLVLAAILLGAAVAFVLGQRGVLAGGAWAAALLAGLPVLAIKIGADLADRSHDAALWRVVLTDAFGAGLTGDAELMRQARLAIEFRARLAEAGARAPAARRRQARAALMRVDGWLDGIVALGRDIATHRAEARFQNSLAIRARDRRDEVAATAASTADLRGERHLAAEGLSAQITAAEAYVRFVETRTLKLEHSVAALGAISSQLVLWLGGGPGAAPPTLLLPRIAAEAEALVPVLPPPPPEPAVALVQP